MYIHTYVFTYPYTLWRIYMGAKAAQQKQYKRVALHRSEKRQKIVISTRQCSHERLQICQSAARQRLQRRWLIEKIEAD